MKLVTLCSVLNKRTTKNSKMKKVLIPKEALEKFVEIAQDNLEENRVLRNELQACSGRLPNCAYCTLAMAMQPCRNYTVLITGCRPAGLQAFLRP
jgi:hypothetical protein